MANKSTTLAELVNKLPDPDEHGLLSNIDKDVVDNVIENIHKGGRKNIIGVINLLVPPGEGDDVKARYALHCLALRVCKLNDDNQSAKADRFARTLASQLGGDRPKAVQAYLAQELQVCGGKEVVGTLGKLLLDEELCEPAAQALAAIGAGAAEQLRNALPKAKGKCRLTIVQNLGVVRDRGAVNALKEVIGVEDPEVRIAAAWALANIGDADSVDLLLRAANTEGWERIGATKACLLLAERLMAAGKKNEASRIYTHLRDTRTDPAEKYVRDAAISALTAVSG